MLTLKKALITVFGCSFGMGLIGSLLGLFIGKVAPTYYLHVFHVDREDFNPVEMGLALGLIQGVIWGGVIGALVVAIMAWYQIRMRGRE